MNIYIYFSLPSFIIADLTYVALCEKRQLGKGISSCNLFRETEFMHETSVRARSLSKVD